MEKQKITLHRALTELKTIESRIHSRISTFLPVGLAQEGKNVNKIYPLEEFIKKAVNDHKSISDLIERKAALKGAIMKANSITIVNINGQSMTIMEAIYTRDIIVLSTSFLNKIERVNDQVNLKLVQKNDAIMDTALNNAQIMLGKQDDSKIKPTDTDVKNIIEPFIKRNEYKKIDPLKLDKVIANMKISIEGFTDEVDTVLSEINAVTFIEV